VTRVLVGMPTRERPDLMPRTLASVREQTLADWRVVVSDDGSGPDSARAVAEHVASLGDERIRYHHQDPPLREYGQGRFLFGHVTDEDYFVILHDDDLLEPSYLAEAVALLDERPDCDAWIATPRLIDRDDNERPELTVDYLERHGRNQLQPGVVPILVPMLRWGFVPLSATVFRVSALRRSGFVDPAINGNYPFELDLVLGLGALGGSAWLDERELLAFRWHGVSLRVGLWYDPVIVDAVVSLLERHRFEGEAETVRRKLLGSKLRRQAELRLVEGDGSRARAGLRKALAANPTSPRSWALAAAAHLLPGPLRALLTPRIETGRQRESHG
jgi:glycosyltransferase involved in cell wall biosynthesis